MELDIGVEGLEEAIQATNRAPTIITHKLKQGMEVAVADTISQRGLAKYPPRTEANRPPAPYYKRGYGYMRKRGLVASSERLGTQFYAKGAMVGNQVIGIGGQRASYGKFAVGDWQPAHMANKGWRKMKEVAKERTRKMGQILSAYVTEALSQVGLLDRMFDNMF